ncbi:MFS transporter [Jiangella alkaliphila]|uniref:Drug resistance transporter, EmrB/QacA subfamily n=1 Tax=Jiangella alkaliphila TaxID=419479 RepID=A0A1H2L7H3_9ACTN|nr:MFS transporter [Jiangella alkaliphila]SDU76675.1 drug resistance transporter, EmrB/QacA subfamily [Jiangella alkaliphila]
MFTNPPAADRWRLLALLGVAQFMLVLDVTVVAVALPDIGAELSLSRSSLTWVVSAYTLMFGGLLLLGGRLADLFGARRVVLAGLTLFTAASLVSGLAWNAESLIGGRVVQGAAAALLSPAALSVVATTFRGTERNRALGVWAALGGAGSAAGVLVGGLLTAGPGWSWIFYVNVPVGIVLVALLMRLMPPHDASPGRPVDGGMRPPRLDVPGAVLVTAATGALIYGLVNAGDDGWTGASTVVPAAVALVLYTVFGALQRRLRAPLIDPWILTRRPVLTGVLLMLVLTALLISSFFLGSFFLQHVRGYSALTTGLLFLPVAVAVATGAHVGGRAVGRVGPRRIAAVALTVAAAGLALAAVATTRHSGSAATALLVAGMSVATAGLGSGFVTATTTALAHVDHHDAGLASGIVNTFHEFGAALGVALASSIAAADLAPGAAGTDGFTGAFAAGAGAAVVAGMVAWALVPAGRPAMAELPLH